MNETKFIKQVVDPVLAGAKSAVKYVRPDFVIKATHFGVRCARRRIVVITLTLGAPNHSSRKFIKQCLRAGEKFPVRKVQLRIPKKP